jgi:hypothetical protein
MKHIEAAMAIKVAKKGLRKAKRRPNEEQEAAPPSTLKTTEEWQTTEE